MNSPCPIKPAGFEEHHVKEPNTLAELEVIAVDGVATPAVRSLMLSRLMGQAFEALAPAERVVMITHLLRPLGMLSLAMVADGVFLKNRCDGQSADLAFASEAVQHIHASDVVALANRVQQVSVEVVDEIAKLIKTSPGMADSPVTAMLAKIPLRRTRARQADDAFS